MERIIQRYQEGGAVVAQPAVATGIPQGGNAANAIAEYMLGTLAGPLSYTGGTQGVPDYLALAAEQKIIREEKLAKIAAEKAAAAAASAAAAAAAASYQATPVYSNTKNQNQGSTAADTQAYFHGGGGGYKSNGVYKPATGFAHGGGADGVGSFGKVGDFFGGIGDSIGVTNYKDKKSSFTKSSGARNMGGPIGYNMGTVSGPIGYNTGGVSVAQSRLSDDERMRQAQLRTPQMLQTPMISQGDLQEKGPLSGLGGQLASGMMMKGANAGVTSLMSKLGTMMGGAGASGAAGAGAGAAAAGGTGLMAAAAPILGPLVIGFGLGKAFGLFNEGGKVTCPICKKQPCECNEIQKIMKSPLSGE